LISLLRRMLMLRLDWLRIHLFFWKIMRMCLLLCRIIWQPWPFGITKIWLIGWRKAKAKINGLPLIPERRYTLLWKYSTKYAILL